MRVDMPVQKFRSIEEMNKAPLPESRGSDFERFLRHCARWNRSKSDPGDAGRGADFERFLRHCARWWAIAPKHYPRGVFKFRTIEDAQKAREKHLPLK